jgi:hypothetical protein
MRAASDRWSRSIYVCHASGQMYAPRKRVAALDDAHGLRVLSS